MLKHTILLLALSVFIVLPQIVRAAPTIGDLNPGEAKPFTIEGLDPNTRYILIFSKLSRKNQLWNTQDYSTLSTDCSNSNNDGQITGKAGPYVIPGHYRLQVAKADPGTCKPASNIVTVSENFSTGGPTGENCCAGLQLINNRSFYFSNEDVCKAQPFDMPLTFNPFSPTICTQHKTYCEPASTECFQSKTFASAGKICIYPTDPDFENKKKDTSKYIVCGLAGGKITPGCTDDPTNPGIATAIGCIHTNPAEFAKDLLKFMIGIGGGLAFLMMLLGAFQMLTSQGNPETLNAGKDRLTSAVIGLLFVIFAVLFLQIIGFDILKIPGFGR